ncbi:uncharacterized protein LOC132205096 [Neocloeon triangulifer]|uniref:uncharacterized protein LOC132205096 n=1 Tax=Neocloeon triangulifer TaxID=2078957 RepID=UPI00286F6E06|nr:uncharacterized protein LOC132205096 [Neocloeon triangulifer]XP_059489948.1 uncharacterized protein LOC132205096 [Neocloeon triangulifer]
MYWWPVPRQLRKQKHRTRERTKRKEQLEMKTVLVVLVLAVVAQAKPARSPYGGIFDHPFFRMPVIPAGYSDEVDSEEAVSAPDYEEVPHPAGTISLGSLMDGIFNRMRQQFERLPALHTPNFESFGFPSFKPNDPNTKSTSTSTIVGDQVVTVNETVYHKEDGGTKSVFRIKVIDFGPKPAIKDQKAKPAATPESTESSVEEVVEIDLPAEKTPEQVQESTEKEFPEPTVEANPESTTSEEEQVSNEMDNEIKGQESLMDTLKRWNKKENDLRSAPDDEVEVIVPAADTPIDLAGDLRVNQILQDQAMKGGLFMPDPDVEFIEVDDEGKLVPDNLQEI